MGDKYTHLIPIRRYRNGSYIVVISDNTLREILNNPHEFVLELRIVVYFVGKSAEYVIGFMELMLHNLKWLQCLFFRHTSHVADTLFTPRMSDNIFINRIFDVHNSFFTSAGYIT
jgi:hypothetical protein